MRRVQILLLPALILLILLAPTSVQAKARKAAPEAVPECFEPWWRAQLRLIETRAGGGEALLPLRVLETVLPTAANPFEIAAALDQVRASDQTHPLVAAEIDIRLVEWDLKRGDSSAARARLDRLGALTTYQVSGPFLQIEQARDALKGFAKTGSAPDSRQIQVGPDGILPLRALLFPAERGHALATVPVTLERNADVALRFGADDRAEVWLDGELLAEAGGSHNLAFDQHTHFFRLGKGTHHLSFIVEQEADGWSLFARLTAPDGGPVAGLTSRGRKGVKGVTIATLLEKRVRKDPALQAHLALDQADRQLPDRQHTDALATIRKLAAQWPLNREVLWARALIETDAALERKSYERLLAFSPSHPAILRRLSRYHLAYGQADLARDYVLRGLKACSQEDPYLEGWGKISENASGFAMGAIAALRELVDRAPQQPTLQERLATLSAREGLLTSAMESYEQALAINQSDDKIRHELLTLLLTAGRDQRYRELLAEAIELEPLTFRWRVQLARHELRAGRNEEALEVIAATRALAPDQPDLLVLEGEALLAAGRTEDAAARWQQAADDGSDATDLNERLAALTGSGDSFGPQYAVSIDRARELLAENAGRIEGNPPAIIASRTDAVQLRDNGLSTKFQQVIMSVRNPDQASFARSFSVSYSPRLERASVVSARLLREDGSVVLASRRESALLPDPQLRMWYDTRVIELTFPRLMPGDLLDVQFRVTALGSSNPIADGYFGDVIVAGHNIPVLDAKIVHIAPPQLPIRHKLVNFDQAPQVTSSPGDSDSGGAVVTTIRYPYLPAFDDAPSSPPLTTRIPYTVLGTMEDWDALGQAYAKLIREQLRPTTDLKEIVKRIAAQTRGRRDLIETLYAWVIENTRYVALEFGINAIKPYSVGSVLQRRHGDCKDKAALLVAMLAEARIDANITLLRSRDRGPLDTTIPVFAAFDHAIAYVPSEDLYLDGTVVHHAAEELPMLDRDALVLIVGLEGEGSGELTYTPPAAPEHASLQRTEEILLDRLGGAQFQVKVVAAGDLAARERAYFRLEDRPTSVLVHRLRQSIVDLTIDQASFDKVGLEDEPVRYRYQGNADRFARNHGERVSSPLAMTLPPLPAEAPPIGRDVPLRLPLPFLWRSESTFPLPEGARLIEQPEAIVIDSAWGRLEIAVQRTGRSIKVVTDTRFDGGEVSVDQIAAFSDFVDQSRQALEQRLVLGWE